MYSSTYNPSNSNISNVKPYLGMPLIWSRNKQVQVRVDKPKKVITKKVVDVAYTYIDARTGKEIGLSKTQLLKLGQNFITFARESQCLFVKTFWEKRGIAHETVKYWCQREPEFKMFFEFGVEMIKGSRESLAVNDMTYLRNTISLYVPEYKAYDIEMIKFKAKVLQGLHF